MNTWLAELSQIVHRLLGAPNGLHEQAIVMLIAILTVFMTFRFAASVAGVSHFSGFGVMMALGVGLLTTLGSAAAVGAFLQPHLPHAAWSHGLLLALSGLALLLVGIPLQCLVMRASYVPMMLAFGSALVATMLVLMFTVALLGSFNAGKEKSDTLRAHNAATVKFMDQ